MLKSEGSERAKRRFFAQIHIHLRLSYIEVPPCRRLFSAFQAEVERSLSEGTAKLPRACPFASGTVKIESDFNSPFSDALGRDSEHEDSFEMNCTICHLWIFCFAKSLRHFDFTTLLLSRMYTLKCFMEQNMRGMVFRGVGMVRAKANIAEARAEQSSL